MGYKYKRRRRNDGFGSAISDTAEIANSFGPKGAAIAGVFGFLFFYFLLPALLVAWIDFNKEKIVGPNAGIFRGMLDEIFIRRFIHPSEWAGIAILIICFAISVWKIRISGKLSHYEKRELTWLGKMLARILD